MSNFKATYSTVVVRAKANVSPTGSKVLLGKFLSSIYMFVGCFLEIKGPHRRRPYKSLYRKNLKNIANQFPSQTSLVIILDMN